MPIPSERARRHRRLQHFSTNQVDPKGLARSAADHALVVKRPAYESLKERIAVADAVIRGRVAGEGRSVVPEGALPGVGTTISTEFQVQILEVYKAHDGADSIGIVVPVRQSGGEAVVGDVVMRTGSGPHVLANGGEFLVFLKFVQSQHQFWTVTSDTFPIVDGRIKVDLVHAQPFAFELDGVLSSDSEDALWRAVRAAQAASPVR